MASPIIFLHSHSPPEGGESDEVGKSTSAISIDCNLNRKQEIVHENAKLENEVVENLKQTEVADLAGIENETSKHIVDRVNNNEKVESPPPQPLLDQRQLTMEEKVSELMHSYSGNVTVISKEVLSSTSACKNDTAAKINKEYSSHEDESSAENTSSTGNNNKESYPEIKSKRKTLLKIEKLTDSDNRSRSKMRRRALSPPSSSDEENLHIGWIAYPASLTSMLRPSRHLPRKRRAVWKKAATFIFYPVTKVCQKCIKNKVAAD